MKWIFLYMALAISLYANGQKYLVLKKRNKVKVAYEAGDKIKFKLKDEQFYTEQMIVGFGQDMIRFHYFDVPLSEIEEIKLVNKRARGFNFNAFSSLFLQIGIGYLVVDQFNQVVIQNQPAGISNSTAIVSANMIATGLLLKLFNKKRFKINNTKYRLEISDYLP